MATNNGGTIPDTTDTTMSSEGVAVPEKVEDTKTTYKSFKKKYRKMRAIFDEKMRASNDLFLVEQQAMLRAKQLAQQNNQILDLLLDANECPQIPAEKRLNLSIETPVLPAIPPLVSSAEVSKASELNTPLGKAAYNEVCALVAEIEARKTASTVPKSLANLIGTIPHLSLSNPLVPPELIQSLRAEHGVETPLRYLTMDQIDEYLYEIDSVLGHVPHLPQPSLPITHQDLALRNPHSVYNWLRQHEPRVFLQDGEGSEKSSGKPGELRGAGKRKSIPAPSMPNTLEFVEEDGAGYEALAPANPRGKRKRDGDDDGGYHPKSGHPVEGKVKKPRQPRKKKSDESNGSVGPRKSKAKAKATSPSPLPPPPVAIPSGST